MTPVELRESDPAGYKHYYEFMPGSGVEGYWETESVGKKVQDADDDEKMNSDDKEEESGTEKEESDEKDDENEEDSDVDLEEEEEGQTKIHDFLVSIDEASYKSDDSSCCLPPKKAKKPKKN